MTDDSPHRIDYRGLRCPLPVIRARKALRGLPAGSEARILADDPSAPSDFTAFCEIAGHELVGITEQDGTYSIRIRKPRQRR